MKVAVCINIKNGRQFEVPERTLNSIMIDPKKADNTEFLYFKDEEKPSVRINPIDQDIDCDQTINCNQTGFINPILTEIPIKNGNKKKKVDTN